MYRPIFWEYIVKVAIFAQMNPPIQYILLKAMIDIKPPTLRKWEESWNGSFVGQLLEVSRPGLYSLLVPVRHVLFKT